MKKFLSLLFLYEYIWLGAFARSAPDAGLHVTGLDEYPRVAANESLANPSKRSSQPVITKQRNALANQFDLTIIHTNDVHAHFLESDARGSPCKEPGTCYGGVARRVTAINKIRADTEHENILILDAGDQSQGTPWYVVYEGAAASHFMTRIGYDMMAIGNHEFDNGVESFGDHFIANVTENGQTAFPITGCNIDFSPYPDIEKFIGCSTIVEFDNVKVGIIGYTTEETPDISDTGSLIFNDVVETIRAESERLRNKEKCHIVIGVGHYGYEMDLLMVPQTDLDVVIGGHSHTLLFGDEDGDLEGFDEQDEEDNIKGNYPSIETNIDGKVVPVCQAFEYGKYLGHIDIKFTLQEGTGRGSNDRYVINQRSDITGKPILLDSSIPEDAETLAELKQWQKPVDELTAEQLGETQVDLDGDRSQVRRRETNLGSFLADAVADDLNINLVILNGGGIRGGIPVGNIDYGNVLTVLPFGGSFDKVQLLGATLWDCFENAVKRYESPDQPGEFLQVSGFKVEYDTTNPVGHRVIKLEGVNDDGEYENIKPDEMYWVGMSDFIAGGGDGYKMIPEQRLDYQRGRNDAEVFKQRIKAFTPINNANAPCGNRIIIDGIDCKGDANDSDNSAITYTAAIFTVFIILFI